MHAFILFLAQPWLIAVLLGYAVVARLLRLPYRFIGVIAVLLLIGATIEVVRARDTTAELLSRASYGWFAGYVVALVLDATTNRNHHE